MYGKPITVRLCFIMMKQAEIFMKKESVSR